MFTFALCNNKRNNKYNTNQMQKQTLKQFWKSIDTAKKDKLRIDMAGKCGKSIDTVQAWMLGYRKPSRLEAEALCKYIKTNFEVEIEEEISDASCSTCPVKQYPACSKGIPCCQCKEVHCNGRQPCPKKDEQ